MPNIVHIGLGNFHRAHQAWYTQQANRNGDRRWGIIGVSMFRRDLRDALAPHDFGYTLALNGTERTTYEWIKVHDAVLVAADEPQAAISAIADPDTHVVTLTITEKGYALDPAGNLNMQNAGITRDLQNPLPQTAIGLLCRGLAERAKTNLPITVISCDNLPDNGKLLAGAVSAFSEAAGLGLGDFLKKRVLFPNTMVDRITPATTPELIAQVEKATGRADPASVATETFTEWVIEDRFAAPRPKWETAGAEFVTDVAPYEARKLRMLNAAHSLLAYGGLLRGHGYVHEAIDDPELLCLVNGLWDEAQNTLPEQSRQNVQSYRTALLARFGVAEMRHALRQIAMDGSLKVASRLIPIIEDRNRVGFESPFCLSAVGLWIAHIFGEKAVQDPLLNNLPPLSSETSSPTGMREIITNSLGWKAVLDGQKAELDASIARWINDRTNVSAPN